MHSMSVLRSDCIYTYVAPSVSDNAISLTGSWSRVHSPKAKQCLISPSRVCHYRIHCWEHAVGPHVVPVCLDWAARLQEGQIRFEIELKISCAEKLFSMDEQISEDVHKLLNIHKDKIRNIQNLFQHEQPGAGLKDSVIGSAGSDGASQSV